jgi:hypothetical protein
MLFRDTTGEPAAERFHESMRATARMRLMALMGADEPVAEMVRAAMAGLALWWAAHPDVPRETVVAAAAQTLGGLGRT